MRMNLEGNERLDWIMLLVTSLYIHPANLPFSVFQSHPQKKVFNSCRGLKYGHLENQTYPKSSVTLFYLDWNVNATVEKDEKWDRLSGFLSDNLCRLLQLNAQALEMSFQL